MSVREYIGARYVPLFMGEWDSSVTYEPLSIVSWLGNSYTSRQFVPANIQIDNETYWAQTGSYNAQVEQYRQEVQELIESSAMIYEDLEDAKASVDGTSQYIKTASYYPNGTSGGAFYEVLETEPSGWYEIADNGMYLRLIDPVNVAQFGAKGDGIADDTTAIQAAIENMDTVVFEGGKTYRTANLLIHDDNKTLIGNGCTLKTDDYQSATVTSALNIGDTKITVNHPEYFHVNQTAMIYNENSNPTFFKVVVMAIEENELTIATYKPFRPADDSADASPYYFPANSVIYTSTQIFTVTRSMNASGTNTTVKNTEITGFRFEQSLL